MRGATMAASGAGGAGAGAAASSADAMFNVTSRFKEAVTLVNRVADDKFPVLLARIIGKLGDKQSEGIFTPQEETQLQQLLSLDAHALHTILEGCSYILEKAAYHQAKARTLGKQLLAAGVTEAKATAFARVWEGEGKALVAKLRTRAMGAPMVLHAAKWEVHLQLGQSGLSRAKDSRAMFELDLRDADDVDDDTKRDNFMMEFSHDQLYDFFQKIERVQQQLDSLSA